MQNGSGDGILIKNAGLSQNCLNHKKAVAFLHFSGVNATVPAGSDDGDMNIQIFGTKKSKDTRAAERFFKERGIRYQYVDMKEKGLSRGEFDAVLRAAGSLDAMLDPDCRDRELYSLVKFLGERDRADKAFENQSVLKLPIVRNGKAATVGYAPDVWKSWM